MTAAPVPPRRALVFAPSLTRSIVRSFVLAAERTDVSVSLRLPVSPPLLLSGCLHTAAVEAQLCFAVGQPLANTPASIGERGDDSPGAGHHGHTHPSIHKVDRGQRARTGWAGLCASKYLNTRARARAHIHTNSLEQKTA